MKQFFTTLIFTLTLWLSVSTSFAEAGVIESDPLDLVRDIAITSTVNVIMKDFGIYSSCSGVVIKNTPNKSIVLTAKHCIGFEGEMYIDGLPVIASQSSLKSDLAYLVVNNFIPNKTPARLSNYIPKNGDKIIAVGYPGRLIYSSKGTIFTQSPIEQLANLTVKKGCSGGGVYNVNGELIGLTIRYYPSINISILVKLEDIHTIVNVNKLLEE